MVITVAISPELAELARNAPEIGSTEAANSKYGRKDGLLYKKTGRIELAWKVCLPENMAEDLIRAYHEHLGHSGSERIALAIDQSFYVKRLANKCRKVIGTCLLCQRMKPTNVKYHCTPAVILRDRPNALVCCDIHGKLPRSNFSHEYIFVLYDVFSKFTKIYPMKAISTRGCLNKILNDYIPKYGHITALLSDNASLFSSPVWRRTLEEHQIQCYHSSVYHPQANPSERILRCISIYLRAYCHENHKKWFSYCPLIEAILNRTRNPTTKVSPEKLMTGKEPRNMFEGLPSTVPIPGQPEVDEKRVVYERLLKRAEQRMLRMKPSKKRWNVQIGERVLSRENHLSSTLKGRNHKMELLYSEPRIVTKKFGQDTFELKDEGTGRIVGRYHKSRLKRIEFRRIEPETPPQPGLEPDPK